jgi:hypothetical protein
MNVSKLSGSFTFSGGRDSARASGSIPNVAALFNPKGTTAVVTINGASVNFTLDAHGHARSDNGTLALKILGKRNKTTHQLEFQGGNVPFTFSLKNGTWASTWKLDPASTAKTLTASSDVTVQLASQPYTATVPITYQIKPGVGGSFKN